MITWVHDRAWFRTEAGVLVESQNTGPGEVMVWLSRPRPFPSVLLIRFLERP